MSLCKALILAVGIGGLSLVGSAQAATSASFVFDTLSDPADLADGPDYLVTASGVVDDGAGCDVVVMVMVDPQGTPVDIDTFCLNLGTGQGGSDGDYGSGPGGALPAFSPVTYALFDLTATDIANTTGLGDTDIAYFNYIVTRGRLLAEKSFAVDGLPTRNAFSFVPKAPTPVPTSTPAGLALLAGVVVAAAAWRRSRRSSAPR